jgi:hypothetical protein
VNAYEMKQQARRERLEARADRLKREGEARVGRAREMAAGIPFGQPILVGHHSEGRDRRYRARIHDNFAKGFESMKEADKVAERAAAVGSGGISSDDPDAVAKLRAELEKLDCDQQRMKDANATVRRHKGEAAIPYLVQAGFPESIAAKLAAPDFCGRRGFPDYATKNNGANMRRIRERIAQLEARSGAAACEREAADGLRIVENVDANRLQMFFPAKPGDTVRASLKSYGFRWSPTEGAWQRHLSNGARYAAECVEKAWTVENA